MGETPARTTEEEVVADKQAETKNDSFIRRISMYLAKLLRRH